MDRRVARTRKQLREALIELLKVKSVQDITVCELADKVEISRGTFYLHYKNVFDMLETVEQELLDRLAAAVREAPMGTRERPFSMLLPCYRFFAEEVEMAAVLMGAYGDSGFFRRAAKIIKARSLSDWKVLFPELTPQETEYLFAFIFGGSLHMLEGWVTGGQKDSPEKMAEYTHRLVADGIALYGTRA